MKHIMRNRFLETETRMKWSRPRRRVLAGACTAAVAALVLAGCSGGSGGGGGGGSASGGSTLTIVDSPETTISQTYNPFNLNSPAYTMATSGMIYEPLLQFNLAKVPDYYPWLATSFTWGPGGKSITFTIRPGVKWNNGQPLTPADVAFTYNLVKNNASINSGGLSISSVTSSSDTVTISFPSPSYALLQQIASVYIVPQAQWKSVTDPATWADADPVGTGPYMTNSSSYTPQGFTLVKNPDYWQKGLPKVSKLYFPVYTSNSSIETALLSGSIDWAGNYFPDLDKVWVSKNPSSNHYWMPARAGNVMIPNLNKFPTNELPVREAISDAINRSAFVSEGESNYGKPMTSLTSLLLPAFQNWLAPEVQSMNAPATSDVAAAKQVLESNGYKMGSDGYFRDPSGKELTLSIIDPSAYTDYAEEDALAATELKAVGINATFEGQSVDGWGQNVSDGNFQLTTHWLNQGITPYAEYDGILDDTLNNGKSSTGDYEGLKDPTIQTELAAVASAETTAQQTAALTPLEEYVAKNLPVIPTLTEPAWFEYNSGNFTGWPSDSNSYELGEDVPPTAEVVILRLQPKS